MKVLAVILAGCALFTAATTDEAAAMLLYHLTAQNPEWGGHFGWSVSWAGDVNHDGYNDVIVGAPHENNQGANPDSCGIAYIFSGATGGILHKLVSPYSQWFGEFGYSVSFAGDVNNDNYYDVIVGAPSEDHSGSPDAGRAYVFSGATGDTLYSLKSPNQTWYTYFGYCVSGAGDVDHDGHDDVIVGAPYESSGPSASGRAYIFSGQTGVLLRTLQSPNAEYKGHFGRSVSGAANVNGDEYADVIVGAPYEDPGASPDSAGRAYVFSGAPSGGVLFTLTSSYEESEGRFGWSVSGIGDTDGDTYADVIVGAPRERGGGPYGVVEGGRAHIFSGATGDTLRTLISPSPQEYGRFGHCVSWMGDVDGYGGGDVVLMGEGKAYVFSSEWGDLLYSSSPFTGGALSVSGTGDVNHDGVPDFVVGCPNELAEPYTQQAGGAYVMSPYNYTLDLSGYEDGSLLRLTWHEIWGASEYWIFGAGNQSYFLPEPSAKLDEVPQGTTTWLSDAGMGDPNLNMTYMVVAVNALGQGMVYSARYGQFDFDTGTGP